MSELLLNVIPILFLIVFGYVLRRRDYFEPVAIQRITNMVANLLIPCVIFNTIITLDIESEHIFLTIGFFLYQAILLGLTWVFYKLLKIKRRFFLFYSCAFAFGFMAIPLFSVTFGEEHMGHLVAMGIGHELFVAIVFITTAKLFLTGQKFTAKSLGQNLMTPLFIMIISALFLKFTGLVPIIRSNVLGEGLFTAISKLGSLTSVLTMIIVGYRISFRSKKQIMESFGYVAFRYALTLGVGYLMKLVIWDRFVAPNPYYDYAFFTLLSQHGSVVLTVFVGEYGTEEDLEVASNAFVINVIVGIIMYLAFVAGLG